MKKIVSLLLAFVLALALSACGGAKSGPGKTVGTFCGAMKSFDLDKMSQCVLSGEDIADEMGDEDDELTAMFMDRMKEWAGKMTYQAEEPTVDGDRATVKVNFHYTDASPVVAGAMEEYLSQAFALALSGSSEEELAQLFQTILTEQLEETSLSTAEQAATFNCTRTDDGWKIDEVPTDVVNVLTGNIADAFGDMDVWGD